MWREVVNSTHHGKNCVLGDPADIDEVRQLERTMGLDLPQTLRDLLLECDGITWRFKPGHALDLVWSTRRIIRGNHVMGYCAPDGSGMGRAGVFAVGDIGPTAYLVEAGRVVEPEVSIAYSSRQYPDLRAFLQETLSDT